MCGNEMDSSSLNVDNSLNLDIKNVSRKHITERQRRARINSYLEEIQSLVPNSTNSKATVKPEKAEVLEKAVIYLQNFKTEKTSDTEYYRQGFNSCISALLDKIPVEFQEKGNLKGLRNHLETFLVNLTTEADTMAYATAMGSSPYIQSPSANWYQQQNVRDAVNVINQSNNALPNNANGTHYSAANDKLNCRSNNLLCSVPGNPKWYSDWNIEMQMQYMEAYQSQPSAQDVSPYDVFQGIKSVYSNYLQDEEGYYSSFEDSNPTKNSCVKHEADSTESILTPQYGQEPGPNSNNVSSKLVQSTDSNCCVLSERTSTGTKTQMCDTPVIKVGQSDTRQIWRPW